MASSESYLVRFYLLWLTLRDKERVRVGYPGWLDAEQQSSSDWLNKWEGISQREKKEKLKKRKKVGRVTVNV